MKTLTLSLLLSIGLLGCGEDAKSPQVVYQDYANAINTTTSLKDFPFSHYLSNDAQAFVIDKLSKSNTLIADFDFSVSLNDTPANITQKEVKTSSMSAEKMQKLLLAMLKSDSQLPATYQETLTTNDNKAQWVITAQHHPKTGNQYEKRVSFVKESQWKINKISTTIADDNSSFKSTTY